MDSPRPEERSRPECITLGVRARETPSPKPPVRIFLGTEPAQHRAERVFIWSIERVRDPARVYEIHLMKGLVGFERRRWTTGFTNYRFAIPHYASAAGCAIYNDVDQIYLDDPARLFDTDLTGHGYAAIAPDDLSVMWIDCAVMAEHWPLEAAQRGAKRPLQERAAGVPGLLKLLPPEWNARDGEYRAGASRLLHFTNLHTQPWRPFPERFVYQRHPQERLWMELERSADAAGFEVFGADHPSECYAALGDDPPLDRVPREDLPWVLDRRFREAERPVHIEVACDPPRGIARGPDGRHEPARTPAWWSERLDEAAARHAGVHWEATLRSPDGGVVHRGGGVPADGSPPRVWVLVDDRAGNTTQSLGLADALGWPYEVKQLAMGRLAALPNRLLGATRAGLDRQRSDALEPPWPDLAIATGRRSAPVAQWLRVASEGRTRLVQLGRKGGDLADLFDLVVTPAYARLFPHPHRLEVHAPLHRVTRAALAEAREAFADSLGALPAPRVVLLAGGRSGQYGFSSVEARKLGEDVAALAGKLGGSVLASASRRTGKAQTEILREALRDAPGVFYGPDDPEPNPYLGYLAWADRLVVTADTESILAEAVSLGRPVYIYPLPIRASFRILSIPREAVMRRATAEPPGPRGTGRPQRGLERLCARLIERGLVRPPRNLEWLHEDLIRRGVAQRFGDPTRPAMPKPLREVGEVAERVRRLLGRPL